MRAYAACVRRVVGACFGRAPPTVDLWSWLREACGSVTAATRRLVADSGLLSSIATSAISRRGLDQPALGWGAASSVATPRTPHKVNLRGGVGGGITPSGDENPRPLGRKSRRCPGAGPLRRRASRAASAPERPVVDPRAAARRPTGLGRAVVFPRDHRELGLSLSAWAFAALQNQPRGDRANTGPSSRRRSRRCSNCAGTIRC